MRINLVFLVAAVFLATYPDLCVADETVMRGNGAATKSEAEINQWVHQLGSRRFKDREDAAHDLSLLGKAALPELQKAAMGSDAEIRQRARQLIQRLDVPAAPAASPSLPAKFSAKSFL